MTKKKIAYVLIILFVLVSGFCYSCKYARDKSVILSGVDSESKNTEDDSDSDNSASATDEMADGLAGNRQEPIKPDMIKVHICGAVKEPGVYEIEEEARLYDLIMLSGGLLEEAAGDYINQAEKLTDGKRYYIPTVKEIEDLPVAEKIEGIKIDGNETKEKLVNINTADKAELMTLPGIGEAKAKSIIEYRDSHGRFKSIEELMNIPGIKEGLFNKIASKIVAN